GLFADARSAGLHLRRGYFLPGTGGEGRCALDGAEREPGGDQGVRPAGVRADDCRRAAGDAARCQGPGRRLQEVGPRGRRRKGEEVVAEGFGELRLGGVTRRFGAAVALDGLDLTIRRGEFVALLGPSGCGKSTALNCVAGLLQVTDGAIWLDERRLDEMGPEDRGFGMVFQNYALFPHMTVRRNVGFGLVTQRRPKAEIARRVDQALALVRLE